MAGIYVAWILAVCTILLVLITPALVGVMLSMESWDMGPVDRSILFLLTDKQSFLQRFTINPHAYLIFAFWLIPLDRSSATPKKVDILEGMHIIK